MKLKRINRGLVLGAVLIVAVVICVVYQTVSFSKYDSDVESAIKDYLDAMCTANIESSNSTSNEKFVELVNKYWESGGSENAFDYNTFTKATTLKTLNYDLENVNGSYESVNYEITDMNISRYGQGCAKVTLSYTVSCIYYGNPLYFDGDYWTLYEFSYDDDYPNENDKYSLQIDYMEDTFILKLSDGEWKIINSQPSGWSAGEPHLIEEGSENE